MWEKKKRARKKKKKKKTWRHLFEQEVAARTGRGWALRRPGSGACRVPINDYKLFRASRPRCSEYLPPSPSTGSQLMTCRARRESFFWLPFRQFFLFSLFSFSLFSFLSFSFLQPSRRPCLGSSRLSRAVSACLSRQSSISPIDNPGYPVFYFLFQPFR